MGLGGAGIGGLIGMGGDEDSQSAATLTGFGIGAAAGLGTTGLHVAKVIAKGIRWQYGSWKNV